MRARSCQRAFALAACCVALGCRSAAAPGAVSPTSGADPASSPDVMIERARSFGAAGDQLRAEQYLSAALAQGADERRVLPLLVGACVADQRYRDAMQHAESYVRRHPSDVAGRFLLATLSLALGQVERGVQELTAVVAAAPEHAQAHYALAVALRDQLGDVARADAHFREYLRLSPGGEHVEEARGSLLAQLSPRAGEERR